jgi:hypothetical protein
MDVAKYIGLFLLKNKYCCLQGLGNLEIKKTPSTHTGTELTGAVYTAHLNPIGSIDDAFPNFIANNEQVSIAKASNEISEFIRTTKAKLAEGGSVQIPSIGAYVMHHNRMTFELDPAFSMPDKSIIFPVAPAPKAEEIPAGGEKPYESYTNYNNYNKQRSVNWNIIAFWGVVIIIGGSILGWSINYFMKQQQPEVKVEQVQPDVVEVPMEQPIADSAALAATAPVSASDTPEFRFIIKEFKTLALAQKKEKQLVSYGYAVSVVNKDSSTFYVVHSMKIPVADTTRIKDSLSKLLNPAGVTILR